MGSCYSRPEYQHSENTLNTLNAYFKGFQKGKDIDEIVHKKLESLGFTGKNTLFCDCCCPDEINHDDPEEDLSLLF